MPFASATGRPFGSATVTESRYTVSLGSVPAYVLWSLMVWAPGVGIGHVKVRCTQALGLGLTTPVQYATAPSIRTLTSCTPLGHQLFWT